MSDVPVALYGMAAVALAAVALPSAPLLDEVDPAPAAIVADADLTELSALEEAHLLLARELRRSFVRCDVAHLLDDGDVDVWNSTAEVTEVAAGRVAILADVDDGSIVLHNAEGQVAVIEWADVGPGEVGRCLSAQPPGGVPES